MLESQKLSHLTVSSYTLFLIHHHWKMYERKLKKKQMLSQNKLGMLTTLRDLVWRKNEAKNIFAEASLPFFLTQPMLNGVKCTCLIYSRPILHFSLDFSLFDNVSAIRFTLSLVKYYNCLLQPIDTNTTWSQDMLIHPSFMLSCMPLLIKYQGHTTRI